MRLPVNYPDQKVCILGMGYVGLTLAVVMAETGFMVNGIEPNPEIMKVLKTGRAHFMETGLDKRLSTLVERGAIRFSPKLSKEDAAPVYIVTVGTPLYPHEKKTNIEAIRRVGDQIAELMTGGEMIILRSTVRVGVTRDVVKAALEKAGKPFHLAFCPERTIEGRALSELRTLPQIVGGLDDDSTLRGAALFSFLTPTIIKVSSLETAEMIKLVNNTQRDLLFAFANEIADYCDICEISADEVIKAANAGYARSVMPLPGPVGGPCLEKDPYILAESITQRGGSATLALAARQFNENLPMRTAQLLATLAEQRGVKADAVKKVSVLGLAFKGRPETSDLRGSLAIPLVQELKKQFPKAQLCGYDPLVPKAETEKLGAVPCASVEDAFKDAHIVLFHTNHPLFEKLDLPELAESCARPAIIYDYWTQFTAEEMFLPERVAYMSLGSKVFGKKR